MPHGQVWPGPPIKSKAPSFQVPQAELPTAPSDVDLLKALLEFLQSQPPPIQRLDPFSEEVLRQAIQDANAHSGKVFPWPRGGPLAVLVTNTHDQAIRIRVHGNTQADNSQYLDEPILEFDVGANRRVLRSLRPDANDPWGPYVFVTAQAVSAVPASGQVRVELARTGD